MGRPCACARRPTSSGRRRSGQVSRSAGRGPRAAGRADWAAEEEEEARATDPSQGRRPTLQFRGRARRGRRRCWPAQSMAVAPPPPPPPPGEARAAAYANGSGVEPTGASARPSSNWNGLVAHGEWRAASGERRVESGGLRVESAESAESVAFESIFAWATLLARAEG